MKTCNACGKVKLETEFPTKSGMQRHGKCKPCYSAYNRKHYAKNKEKLLAQKTITNKRYMERNRLYVISYLLQNPCIVCGFADIRALQFDHRDGVRKEGIISKMVHNGNSLQSLKLEISKCDVRCANCHSIRTSKQFNHFKQNLADIWDQAGTWGSFTEDLKQVWLRAIQDLLE
jgi:hypothetical protein